MSDEMKKAEAKDFELQAKIPDVGEMNLKLYSHTWNGLLKFIQNQYQWRWLLVLLLSGTIGAPTLIKFLPLSAPPPKTEIPSQTR